MIERRADLIKQGVPLKAACGRKYASTSASRSDVLWRNVMSHRWSAAHPDATAGERKDQVRLLAAMWSDMCPVQQSAAIAELDLDDTGVQLQSDSDIEQLTSKRQTGEWDPGDADWPVSPQVLEAFIGDNSSAVVRSTQERIDARAGLVVGSSVKIPDDIQMKIRISCCEAHPGLCFTDDAAIYQDALLCASNLERICGAHVSNL